MAIVCSWSVGSSYRGWTRATVAVLLAAAVGRANAFCPILSLEKNEGNKAKRSATTLSRRAAVNGGAVNGNAPINGGNAAVNGNAAAATVVDVVLFGVGDLRTDDHVGLFRALEQQQQHSPPSTGGILPLFLLDADVLAKIPGAVAHTADTALMLHEALAGLDESLQRHWDLSLQVVESTKNGEKLSAVETIRETVLQAQPTAKEIRVHVCDLGVADNAMEYGAFAALQDIAEGNSSNLNIPITVVPWNQDLRPQPWKVIQQKESSAASFPDSYPDYEAKFIGKSTPQLPVDPTSLSLPSDAQLLDRHPSNKNKKDDTSHIPSSQVLQDMLMQALNLDETTVKAQVRTGLYATHWGGLAAATVRPSKVLECLQIYASDCMEDDDLWDRHPSYIDRNCRRKGTSLEHAAMVWQLRGDGTHPAGTVQNWMAGESMVRFLAAPLLLGTLSPRRIWHASKISPLAFVPPLKRLVEGREWHRLLAAYQILQGKDRDAATGTQYKYWRYHGFLCRYAQTDLTLPPPKQTPLLGDETAAEDTTKRKEGVLLIHGFGASGAQWNKAMKELQAQFSSSSPPTSMQGLAPDMLGFGQSEKPGISYTGYLWDAMMQEFVKEVAVAQHGWESYVVGGNSIGGYTAMSVAASEQASMKQREVSASGAPGTRRCTGLVLMNSAGPVKTTEEVAQAVAQAQGNPYKMESVAQVTAADALPPCKPPPRPASRIFGHVLMSYLRPRIGSICSNLYPTNPKAVDKYLCDNILRDSLDPGAIHVMMAGAKLPPPRPANELLAADFGYAPADPNGSLPESVFDGPVLVAQGVLDPLNDAQDRMERFGALRKDIRMDPIQAGHCPHDEVPDQVAASIAKWMTETYSVRQARLVGTTTFSSSSAAAASATSLK